jgi:hypothetical protein
MLTLAPAATDKIQDRIFEVAGVIGRRLSVLIIGAGLLAFLILDMARGFEGVTIFEALAAASAALGVMVREFKRGKFYAKREPTTSLVTDSLIGIATAAGLTCLWLAGQVNAANVLFVYGLMSLIVAHLLSTTVGLSSREDNASVAQTRRDFWHCGKWALPSVVVTWVQSNSYVYLVAFWVAAEAVADIAVARLFLMPTGLVITAWSNTIRPKFAMLRARGEIRELSISSATNSIALAAFVGAWGFAAQVWQTHVQIPEMAHAYQNITGLIFAWTGYFLANAFRTCAMASSLSSTVGFRSMFGTSVASCLFTLTCLAVALGYSSAVGVVIALTIGEIFWTIIILVSFYRQVRRQQS